MKQNTEIKKTYKKIKLDKLTEHEQNPNTHTQTQINQIKKSIINNNYITPIIVDEQYVILSGHGRYRALKELNKDIVECLIVEGLSDKQKLQFVIADNKIAKNSIINDDLMVDIINSIDNVDYESLGITESEIKKLFSEEVNVESAPQLYDKEYMILVTLKNEEDQEVLYNELQEKGFEVKLL